MAIDASIALGVKPVQIESPLNQMANVYALQNAAQSNQLNKMKMDEYTRGVAETEQFKNALAQSKDETSIRNAFYAKGDVKGYNDYLKSVAEQKKLGLETTNLGYAGQETQGKIAKQKQDFIAQAFRNISQNPSNENITAWGQDAVLNKHFSLEEANQIVSQLISMPVEQRQSFLASQGATAGDLMVKPSNLATLQKELNALPLNDPRRKEYEAAIRNETLNPELQSYETAVKQGFKGSIFDFKRQLAEAGRSTSTSVTKIDNFEPASVAAQKAYINEVSATRTQLKNVKGTLDSIDKAKALVPTAKGFMGPGGEALLKATSFLNNRIGTNINVKGITDATELRTRLFGNIMENLKKLDAQPSQAQQFIMQDALGTLGTDPNAMNKVLDAYAEVLKNKVADYNKDVTDAEARGVKFPYKPQIDLGIPTKANAPAGKNPHAAKTDAQIKKELGL